MCAFHLMSDCVVMHLLWTIRLIQSWQVCFDASIEICLIRNRWKSSIVDSTVSSYQYESQARVVSSLFDWIFLCKRYYKSSIYWPLFQYKHVNLYFTLLVFCNCLITQSFTKRERNQINFMKIVFSCFASNVYLWFLLR